MGWDYYTYRAQPAFFIEEIIACMRTEQRFHDIKNKKQSNG